MFPFKWKLSAKLLAILQKEPNYKGAVLCAVQTELPWMFCPLNIKVIPTEGHSSTCRAAEPQEMFHVEHRLCGATKKIPSGHQIPVGQEGRSNADPPRTSQNTGYPSLTSQGRAWHSTSILSIYRC